MRITTLALTLLAVACGKNTEITAPSPTGLVSAVVGVWNLTQGCGGIVYLCRPADSLGVPNRVVFRADGTVDLYRGGDTTPTHGTYTVTASKTDSLRSGSIVLTPGLEEASDKLALSFSIEGELMLAEPCCDRLAYTYVRPYGPD